MQYLSSKKDDDIIIPKEIAEAYERSANNSHRYMRTESCGKAKYFITFIDDHSRWCEVRFLKAKSDAFVEFKKVKALLENQSGKKIKFLQSDNGTEYLNKPFNEFLDKHGIRRRLTIARNPEQNGIAERKNRSLVETGRCLLIQAGLADSFWAEAISAATYIRNRCPSKSLGGKTPYEVLHGDVPSVQHLKEFGSKVLVLNRSPTKGKFDNRCKQGILLGCSDQSKGYRVFIPKEGKVEITRDIKLLKTSKVKEDLSKQLKECTSPNEESILKRKEIEILVSPTTNGNRDMESCVFPESDDDQEREETLEDVEELPIVSRRGPGRPKIDRTGARGRPRKVYNEVDANILEAEYVFLAEIPIKQAISGADSSEWYQAMTSELKSIIQNDTWEIVDRPNNRKVIGSRMVLRNKFGPDGKLEKRKARIVAKGFTQKPGVDFNETFSPVARLSSVRLATALATQCGMKITQLDITTAYLNGSLDEDIFMEIPDLTQELLEHIVRTDRDNSTIRRKADKMLQELKKGDRVCYLKKALYGLKQAGRQWYVKLDKVLRSLGACRSNSDHCVYYQGQGTNLTLIVVYVDDILIISNNITNTTRFKTGLSQQFIVKDLGDVKYCLGLEFVNCDGSFTIHQKGYVHEILNRFGMSDCKSVSTPIDISTRSVKAEQEDDVEEVTKFPYRELVGSLMYLAMATRPDIAHAVSWLSRYNDCYDRTHWTAAKRVLRYLKGTAHYGVTYKVSDKPLFGYVDADWGNCPNDRRSYTGFAFLLADGAISWESRKQRTVALSSTEAEYMGMTEAVKEAIYLKRFLLELGFEGSTEVTLFCDNVGAQKLATNPVFHSRTKHIDIRHHFIREAVNEHHIKLVYTPTEKMTADVLTKGLSRPKHWKCIEGLGMSYTSHNEGEY